MRGYTVAGNTVLKDGRSVMVCKSHAEAETVVARMTNPNYPFADNMVFCSEHSKNHDICDVIECPNCHLG